LAYIGAVTPGVPTTFFALLAAWAFSKSSPQLDKWLHEHPLLGKYLTNWEQKRVYPQKGRIMMVVVMCISLISMFFTVPLKVVGYAAFTFTLICIWAFRYPGSEAEYDRRVKEGKKIGWLK
jgi:uncharacterized membrane protein YbaN (DUF454 family)